MAPNRLLIKVFLLSVFGCDMTHGMRVVKSSFIQKVDTLNTGKVNMLFHPIFTKYCAMAGLRLCVCTVVMPTELQTVENQSAHRK